MAERRWRSVGTPGIVMACLLMLSAAQLVACESARKPEAFLASLRQAAEAAAELRRTEPGQHNLHALELVVNNTWAALHDVMQPLLLRAESRLARSTGGSEGSAEGASQPGRRRLAAATKPSGLADAVLHQVSGMAQTVLKMQALEMQRGIMDNVMASFGIVAPAAKHLPVEEAQNVTETAMAALVLNTVADALGKASTPVASFLSSAFTSRASALAARAGSLPGFPAMLLPGGSAGSNNPFAHFTSALNDISSAINALAGAANATGGTAGSSAGAAMAAAAAIPIADFNDVFASLAGASLAGHPAAVAATTNMSSMIDANVKAASESWQTQAQSIMDTISQHFNFGELMAALDPAALAADFAAAAINASTAEVVPPELAGAIAGNTSANPTTTTEAAAAPAAAVSAPLPGSTPSNSSSVGGATGTGRRLQEASTLADLAARYKNLDGERVALLAAMRRRRLMMQAQAQQQQQLVAGDEEAGAPTDQPSEADAAVEETMGVLAASSEESSELDAQYLFSEWRKSMQADTMASTSEQYADGYNAALNEAALMPMMLVIQDGGVVSAGQQIIDGLLGLLHEAIHLTLGASASQPPPPSIPISSGPYQPALGLPLTALIDPYFDYYWAGEGPSGMSVGYEYLAYTEEYPPMPPTSLFGISRRRRRLRSEEPVVPAASSAANSGGSGSTSAGVMGAWGPAVPEQPMDVLKLMLPLAEEQYEEQYYEATGYWDEDDWLRDDLDPTLLTTMITLLADEAAGKLQVISTTTTTKTTTVSANGGSAQATPGPSTGTAVDPLPPFAVFGPTKPAEPGQLASPGDASSTDGSVDSGNSRFAQLIVAPLSGQAHSTPVPHHSGSGGGGSSLDARWWGLILSLAFVVLMVGAVVMVLTRRRGAAALAAEESSYAHMPGAPPARPPPQAATAWDTAAGAGVQHKAVVRVGTQGMVAKKLSNLPA